MRRLLVFLVAGFLLMAPVEAFAKGGNRGGGSKGGTTTVRGYTKKDGTYVQGHHRTAPDGRKGNNWSTRGNVNPYTGKPGTKPESP